MFMSVWYIYLIYVILYYFELKNIYMAKYFYLDCDKWFNSLTYMIQISYSGKIAPAAWAVLTSYIFI